MALELNLLDLPLEVLTAVCLQLGLQDLVRVSASCTCFRHGGVGLKMVELPTKSPVVTALREHTFQGSELIPSSRPIGCSESWVAYLARCVRQRRCREAPLIAAGNKHSLFVDMAGRLLECGRGAAVGHGDVRRYCDPSPVAAMAGIRVRSVAAGFHHSLALVWDGRVYSWGENAYGQLGQGDELDRLPPTPVEGLKGVFGIAVGYAHSLAVAQSGGVLSWGRAIQSEAENELRPTIVEGFGAVRVRSVCAGGGTAFAIGEAGQLFSWGADVQGNLGHGVNEDQPSPKRVEALRDVRVSSVLVGCVHAMALKEDGLVYVWGYIFRRAVLGNPHVENELLPKPVEALRGVRVGSIGAVSFRRYAVADTGEVWAWGLDNGVGVPLGHGEQFHCPLPKSIESLRGIKVDAVAASAVHTLALANDGSVYTWGDVSAGQEFALGLGPSVSGAGRNVHTPQRIPDLRVAFSV
jgi:alpha-tubulin suppressor-like RCC1 family protein